MHSFLKFLAIFLFCMFIAPALVSLAIWQADASRPDTWHSANWNSSGILKPALEEEDAVIHVMAARTGRWKGAFSVHTWIVTKRKGEAHYQRYDKVGWGNPVRVNAYAADAYWYSNTPYIVETVRGDRASKFIPRIEASIVNYPYAERGSYHIWPGPNSNSFIAHVLNSVPELGLVLPANAVGRDFPSGSRFVTVDENGYNVQVSFAGYLGFAAGTRSGLELHFLGLVAGIDFNRPGLKLPGFGNMRF